MLNCLDYNRGRGNFKFYIPPGSRKASRWHQPLTTYRHGHPAYISVGVREPCPDRQPKHYSQKVHVIRSPWQQNSLERESRVTSLAFACLCVCVHACILHEALAVTGAVSCRRCWSPDTRNEKNTHLSFVLNAAEAALGAIQCTCAMRERGSTWLNVVIMALINTSVQNSKII